MYANFHYIGIYTVINIVFLKASITRLDSNNSILVNTDFYEELKLSLNYYTKSIWQTDIHVSSIVLILIDQ